jgi:integrase/recombinase XerD
MRCGGPAQPTTTSGEWTLLPFNSFLGHWTVSSTMRYVRPSATFIEDAYRRAVTSTLAELSGEDGLA